jgi:superfamily I DNA/RNA helicase
MGNSAGVMTDALAWAGTFHGIGARLLREYSKQIGLGVRRFGTSAFTGCPPVQVIELQHAGRDE